MRRLFVIPLVGVMLAALAVPVLAEENENSGTLTIPTESKEIEVLGKYEETTGAITMFSVDIKWGNMKAIYAPQRTKEWDPDTLTFNDIEGSTNPWTWDRTTSSNGVEPNEISITNKSSTSITCKLQFQKDPEASEVNGTILNKSGDEQEDFNIISAEKLTGNRDEKLPQITTSGFLQLSGQLNSSQSNFQKIGSILVTLTETGA